MLENVLFLTSHCYLSSIFFFLRLLFSSRAKTNVVFHHYLGLNSVGKEVRNMGVDKHKNTIQIKLAFAFFWPSKRSHRIGGCFILLQYGCTLAYWVSISYVPTTGKGYCWVLGTHRWIKQDRNLTPQRVESRKEDGLNK